VRQESELPPPLGTGKRLESALPRALKIQRAALESTPAAVEWTCFVECGFGGPWPRPRPIRIADSTDQLPNIPSAKLNVKKLKGRRSRVDTIELDLPDDLVQLRPPVAVNIRRRELLDRQESGATSRLPAWEVTRKFPLHGRSVYTHKS
jgi:hypothetical protein